MEESGSIPTACVHKIESGGVSAIVCRSFRNFRVKRTAPAEMQPRQFCVNGQKGWKNIVISARFEILRKGLGTCGDDFRTSADGVNLAAKLNGPAADLAVFNVGLFGDRWIDEAHKGFSAPRAIDG